MSEDRIARLEEQITFQEDVIQKLDGVLADQQKQLMEAERKIELMILQLRKLEANQPAPLDYEKPPHY